MSKQLAKSPEMLEKEAHIRDLQTRLKRAKTTLKSLKTRLQNSQQEIFDIQMKSSTQLMHRMERMDELRQEIAALAVELKKIKNMDRAEKEQLQNIADELTDFSKFGDVYDQYQENKNAEAGNFDFEEKERAKIRDAFGEFRVQPAKEEQRDIRRVFLRLSKQFHPDKARNEREVNEYHHIMQQLNEAYQNGDIHTLLEMEQLYLDAEQIDAKAATVDSLQQNIERLQRNLQFIENQIERTSQEIKQLRRSDLGVMLTSLNRADREGEGLDDWIEHLDKMVALLERLRDGLKDSIEKGEVSPLLIELAMGENPFDGMEDEIDVFDLFGQMMGEDMEEGNGDFDLGDLFEGMFEEGFDEQQPLDDPTFPIGSSVRVKLAVISYVDNRTSMRGWVGRVTDAYQLDEQRVYDVEFDSLTLQKMPKRYVRDAVEDQECFSETTFYEHQLEATEPRDNPSDIVPTFRKLHHRYVWFYLDKPQKTRLQKILLQMPEKDDWENWNLYLKEHLAFPFIATARGDLGHLPERTPLKVLSIDSYDLSGEAGYVMEVENRPLGRFTYPLSDLEPVDKKSKQYEILDDYLEWKEMMLGDDSDF